MGVKSIFATGGRRPRKTFKNGSVNCVIVWNGSILQLKFGNQVRKIRKIIRKLYIFTKFETALQKLGKMIAIGLLNAPMPETAARGSTDLSTIACLIGWCTSASGMSCNLGIDKFSLSKDSRPLIWSHDMHAVVVPLLLTWGLCLVTVSHLPLSLIEHLYICDKHILSLCELPFATFPLVIVRVLVWHFFWAPHLLLLIVLLPRDRTGPWPFCDACMIIVYQWHNIDRDRPTRQQWYVVDRDTTSRTDGHRTKVSFQSYVIQYVNLQISIYTLALSATHKHKVKVTLKLTIKR